MKKFIFRKKKDGQHNDNAEPQTEFPQYVTLNEFFCSTVSNTRLGITAAVELMLELEELECPIIIRFKTPDMLEKFVGKLLNSYQFTYRCGPFSVENKPPHSPRDLADSTELPAPPVAALPAPTEQKPPNRFQKAPRTIEAADKEIGRLSEQLRNLRETLTAERDAAIAERDRAVDKANEAIAERNEAQRKLNRISDIVDEDDDDDEDYKWIGPL